MTRPASQAWTRQLSRFVSVGLLATAIHTIIALVAIRIFGFSSAAANITAFLSATVFSYSLNSIWSFEATMAFGSLSRFLVVSLFNLGLITIISYLIDRFGYAPELSVLIIVITMPLITFYFHRFWTFSETGRDAEG